MITAQIAAILRSLRIELQSTDSVKALELIALAETHQGSDWSWLRNVSTSTTLAKGENYHKNLNFQKWYPDILHDNQEY